MSRHLKKTGYWRIAFAILFLGIMAMRSANAGIIEGNPNGNVTLVEFLDYTCPHCQAMNGVIDALIRINPQLRVVFRPVPVLGPNAWFAASSVIASARQKNFLVLHNALLNAREPPTRATVLAIARAVGIHTRQLLHDMQAPSVQDELNSNRAVANEIGLSHLPTLIIGRSQTDTPSAVFYGETPLTQLETAIQHAEIPATQGG